MSMRPMDTLLKTRMSPSLAIYTLVALTPEKHEVIVVNENIEKIDYELDVDLVAITVTVDVFSRAIQIASKFRNRGIPTIAGGIHISSQPQEAMKYFSSICVGMAERIWKKVLSDVEAGSLQKCYCDMDNIRGDEIVSPAYDKIDKSKYFYTNIISTSRGCPFKCDFCYNSSKNSPDYIKRPIENVLNEIKSLRSRHIMFIDDNFIGDIAWTKEFCKRINTLGLKWNCAVSVNILNHLDLLDMMKDAGCQSLFIGIESINANSIKSVHKVQNNIKNYDKLIKEIHDRNMMVNASIVFGLDDDDSSVFDTTLEWMIRRKVETVTAHILTPYPGTKLYKKMCDENKIFDFDLSHYNTANVVYYPNKMSPKELYDGYINFYKKFYSFKNIIKRIPTSKSQWMTYFLFNFVYRKFGKITETFSYVIPLNLIGKIISILCYKNN